MNHFYSIRRKATSGGDFLNFRGGDNEKGMSDLAGLDWGGSGKSSDGRSRGLENKNPGMKERQSLPHAGIKSDKMQPRRSDGDAGRQDQAGLNRGEVLRRGRERNLWRK